MWINSGFIYSMAKKATGDEGGDVAAWRAPAEFAVCVLVGTLLWAAWNESLAPGMLVQGALVSFSALVITNRFLLKAPYQQVFRLHPFTLFRYVAVLVLAIFQSGIHAMAVTLTGRMDVRVIDLPTRLRNPFHGVLVANAITLTPGTVTVDHTEGRFKVIWIECLTTDPEVAGELIKGRFERVFMPRERRKGAG